MSRIKRWNGKEWADIDHSKVKRWNGKEWVKAVVKRWNGKEWDIISEQRHVTEYPCTWTQSYHGKRVSGSNQKPNWLGGNSLMHCGRYGEPYTFDWDWEIQKSMAGFNWQKIQADLKGAEIEKVEIYLRNKHWWYHSGGYAVLGYHNAAARNPRFSFTKTNVMRLRYNGRDAEKWITMPKEFGQMLKNGTAKGFVLYPTTEILDYYGYFYGAGHGSSSPRIRITYKK